MKATKENFFKAQDPSASAKGDGPVHAAYAIMATETRQREAKTARLRALRLEQEANTPPPTTDATAKPKRKSAVRRSRVR
jgi:hypothetical protein